MAGLNHQTKTQLFHAVGQMPEFNGFGIAYIGSDVCEVLRHAEMPAGYRNWIVLKEEENAFPDKPAPAPQASSSSVGSELLSMGLSCTSAVLAGTATVAGAAAAPISGGTSVVIMVIGYAASVASAAQCGIATGRVINAIFVPENNQILDSNEWMKTTSNVLEVISLAGAVAGLGQAAKVAIRLQRSSGKSMLQVLKGMSRAERKRLAQDIAEYSGKAATRRQFIRLVRAGKFPKIFTQRQISNAVTERLLESIGSTLDIGGSAWSGMLHVYFTED